MISQSSIVHILKLGQRKQQPLQPPATTPTASNRKPFWHITGTVTITGVLRFYMTQNLGQDESEWYHNFIKPFLHIWKFAIYIRVSNSTLSKLLMKIFLWSVFTNFMQLLSIYPACNMHCCTTKNRIKFSFFF